MPFVRTQAEHFSQSMVYSRRDFHQHPEMGWTEFRTASLVAERLDSLGWQVRIGTEVVDSASRMGLPDDDVLETCWQRAKQEGAPEFWLDRVRGGFTGVVGVLDCGPGPTLAMRFDMDALGVQESMDAAHRPTREGFASQHDGVMHACGHDAHTSVGLAVAEALYALKDELHGQIRLVFQPAEEGVRGALSMVKAGVLDRVDYFVGHHVTTSRACKEMIAGMGGWTATQKFDVFFRGEPAHAGGNPQGGHNALLAAAAAVTGLYAIPRHSDGPTRVNVGQLFAGTGRNVIPDRAQMLCEVRGADTELCAYMYEKALCVVAAAADMYGCSAEVKKMGSAPSASSSPELAERVVSLAAQAMPHIAFFPAVASGGSEDATYMMRAVQETKGQAVMIGVGADYSIADYPGAAEKPPLAAHTSTFDINEGAMVEALDLLCNLALDLLA